MRRIFIAGGTGFIGQAVIPRLLERGWPVTALARPGSERRLPRGVDVVTGNALDESTYSCGQAETFLHLVGAAHPAPWKAAEFRAVDLRSLKASVAAATAGGVKHFIFLSVAQPSPIMRAYLEVRSECERIVASAGFASTFLRPWYVLGSGRSWPVILKPAYALAERIPATRDGAVRLGLVTLEQMASAIVWSVANPTDRTRILAVPDIPRFSNSDPRSLTVTAP